MNSVAQHSTSAFSGRVFSATYEPCMLRVNCE